jgi:hypothetical protein
MPQPESGLHGSGYTKFQSELLESGMYSIDAFMEYRNDYREIGRKAIAHALIRFEQEALLWPDERNGAVDNWYAYLFNKLTAGIRPEAFNSLPVSFITFNYDRSLRYFLLHGLMARYGMSEERAWSLLSQIPIIHVHGDLGALPLQPVAKGPSRPYHPILISDAINSAAEHITIVQAAKDDSDEFKRARGFLATAERIYFLGFGYHADNMRRLGFEEGKPFGGPNHIPIVLGTAFEISPSNRNILNRKYPNLGLARGDFRVTQFLDDCQYFLDDVTP